MKDVILQTGGKKILDVNKCIFFYIKNKKDLDYVKLDNNKNLKKLEFPLMYVNLSSKISNEKMVLVFPIPKNMIKFDKLIEDYKNNKISDEIHDDNLDLLMKTFIISHLKNGIFRNSDVKINLLNNTKLVFVNANVHTDEQKKKYFSKLK